MSTSPDLSAGALAGTVRDADGGALPGVLVEADASGASRVTYTEADGRYRLVGLPVGTYRVAATLTGFTPAEATAEVRPRETTVVDVTLQLAAVEG